MLVATRGDASLTRKKKKKRVEEQQPLRINTTSSYPQVSPSAAHRLKQTIVEMPSARDRQAWVETQRCSAAYCLPIIGFQNDPSGQALKFISLTNRVDNSDARLRARPSQECAEICTAIHKYRDDNAISRMKLDLIDQFCREIEHHLTSSLRDLGGRTVSLEIYGSTKNGFGTRDCDVDMSLSFRPNPPEWARFSADQVMREVAKALVDYPATLDERFIAAKVPIVRFRGVHMDIEADISYENRLALYNTSLLSHYCSWDTKRLPACGVWIKTWAKRCGIGDASRGGLSSYGWIVMLIHYMQNRGTPPLLRRLQEEHYSSNQDQFVGGWNVYFWKFYNPHENATASTSVYDIFVGFLDFYINFFTYRRIEVIQIRHSKFEPRPERWNKHSLCIQDPFELDHNLAQGVDSEMMDYILACLIKSRTVFLDRSRRSAFLATRGIVETTQMDARLIAEYGDYLLHCCTLDRQPPWRSFFRDRTYSQCTTGSGNSGGQAQS